MISERKCQSYQEDKEAVFGAIDTVKQCLEVFTPMFATMTLRRDNMRKAASRGFINATDCADYLTKKGVPFRDAYKTVGRLVNQCIKADETLETMTMRDFAAILPRMSSQTSGFFFCGMMDEPVEYASSSSTNLNSHEHQEMISSDRRDRCIIRIESAESSSTQ